jgi:hypothetical protein
MEAVGAWRIAESPAEGAVSPAHLARLGPVWSEAPHVPAAAGAMAPGPHEVPGLGFPALKSCVV